MCNYQVLLTTILDLSCVYCEAIENFFHVKFIRFYIIQRSLDTYEFYFLLKSN